MNTLNMKATVTYNSGSTVMNITGIPNAEATNDIMLFMQVDDHMVGIAADKIIAIVYSDYFKKNPTEKK